MHSVVSSANSFIHPNQVELIFNLDNDILFGTDREYTAGSHFLYGEENISIDQTLFNPLFDVLLPKSSTESYSTLDQTLLATEIFTFKEEKANRLQSIANTGWTYFGFRSLRATKQKQLGLEILLGWVGPGSGGEEIQNTVHQLIGNSKETGWSHQYPNQPTLTLMASEQTALPSLSTDSFNSFYTLGSTLSNLRTNVSVGLGVSFAKGCQPSFFYNHLNTIKFGTGWGWFAYSTLTFSYEIYNTLTDGRLFTDDKPLLSKNKFIPLADVGIGLTYQNFSVNYSTKTTSQYYENQPESRFRYSSLNFQWAF